MSLEEVRVEIDRIDKEILSLFEKRMDCARQVAEIKAAAGIPVLNPKREEEILQRVEQEGGALGGYARVLFSTLMEVSRSLQHDLMHNGAQLRQAIAAAENREPSEDCRKLHIGCQGVAGAYSHQAAQQFFPGSGQTFYPAWEDVFHAVESGAVDYGILPVENSSAGSVSEVYDLILQYHFYIVGAVELPVSHCLAANTDRLEDIRKVYSHPQALAQCSEFIKKHNMEAVPYSNTAVAAQLVAEKGDGDIAAICSPDACTRRGLRQVACGIQNSRENSTRFVVLSKKLLIAPGAQKISLCFTLPHKTGSLHMVLSRFSAHGLNLTKIESRPIAGKKFEYNFYLDFTGNVGCKETCDLLCALSEELPSFFFLGNYHELCSSEG